MLVRDGALGHQNNLNSPQIPEKGRASCEARCAERRFCGQLGTKYGARLGQRRGILSVAVKTRLQRAQRVTPEAKEIKNREPTGAQNHRRLPVSRCVGVEETRIGGGCITKATASVRIGKWLRFPAQRTGSPAWPGTKGSGRQWYALGWLLPVGYNRDGRY